MTTTDLIRAQLSSVRKDLAETFPYLTDDMLEYAPAQGMRTIHGQFVEILATEKHSINKISGEQLKPFDETLNEFWEVKTVDGLIKKVKEVRQDTLAYLTSLDEASLAGPAPVSAEFAQWLELETVPISEVFRLIARHESYHTGQLVSYLWARGNNPYDWD